VDNLMCVPLRQPQTAAGRVRVSTFGRAAHCLAGNGLLRRMPMAHG